MEYPSEGVGVQAKSHGGKREATLIGAPPSVALKEHCPGEGGGARIAASRRPSFAGAGGHATLTLVDSGLARPQTRHTMRLSTAAGEIRARECRPGQGWNGHADDQPAWRHERYR